MPQPPEPPPGSFAAGLLDRLKHHKVIEWTLAYAALAYTVLHGVEMLSAAQEWPHVIVRVFSLVLILGVPVVATLAWYHGAKGLKGISGPELAILTVLLFIAGSLLWFFGGRAADKHEITSAQTATPEVAPAVIPTAATAPRTAVAVLPFANLTGDASKEYLGDGMAEELINTLAQVQGLKVPARTSSFAYKGRNVNIKDIAQDLQVGTILEGSVRAAGKRIRITAQLINAKDGLHLWSGSYDEEFTDIFKLQDKLARQIAQALQPSLGEAVQAVVAQGPPTHDVEAYDLFLKGWALLSAPSVPNLEQAVVYFQQAISRDPKFARAYAGVAQVHTAWYRLTYEYKPHLDAAVHFARLALALDPQSVSAHGALASAAGYQRQMFEMEVHSRKALALEDNDGWTHMMVANSMFSNTGHMRRVIEEAQRGYALAPANPTVVALLALTHSTVGHDEDALRFAKAAVDLGYPVDGSNVLAVRALHAMRTGQYAEAAEVWTGPGVGKDFGPSSAGQVVRLVYAALADPSRRGAALEARDRLFPKSALPAGNRTGAEFSYCMSAAISYSLLNALDVAYDLANQCLDDFEDGQVLRIGQIWAPEFRAFRRDPRFQQLATRLGLMEYWEEYGPPDDCELKEGKLTCH
jgi:adenylate cyclase